MIAASALLRVTDEDLGEVTGAERGVLVLAKSDCGYCAAYQRDLEGLLARGKLAAVAIGKLVLDQRGALQFKRANPWLAALEFLPYTLLYRGGERVDGFGSSKSSYLLERVEDAFGAA